MPEGPVFQHAQPADAEVARELHVGDAIADHRAAGQVDCRRGKVVLHQRGFRLAALAAIGRSVRADADRVETDALRGEGVDHEVLARIELPVPDGQKKVSISNTGKNLLYVRVVRTGTPMPGEESPANNGLAVDVRYQNMSGEWLDPKSLEQGTDFQAVVTIQHPGIRGRRQSCARAGAAHRLQS